MTKVADYIRRYPTLKQFLKFCIVGASSAVINFSILFIFTRFVGVWYIYSSVLAYLLSAVFNFSANKFWTFRNKEGGKMIFDQTIKFLIVMVTGLLINTAILFALTEIQGFDYRVSWVFATGVVAVWNYSFNRFWTFRHKDTSSFLSDE